MMVERAFDKELFAKNYFHGLKIAPETIRTWDPGLWRGPRLLVPIHLEALVVTAQNATGPWATVRLDPYAIPGYSEHAPEGDDGEEHTTPQPAPFEIYEERPTGVHLHWALPDGLTRGRQSEPPEQPPPQADETGLPEQLEPTTPQETDFPVIPDRWLVVRLYSEQAKARRVYKAWVIESEEDDPAARVTPLQSWQEDRSDKKRVRWMTALGLGDPSFAAYYDNVKDILGFHDGLDDGARGPLTYLVLGWYSRPEDDPLYKPLTKDAWFAALEELGWTLEGTIEDQQQRVEQAADEAKQRLEKSGLRVRYQKSDDLFTLPKTGSAAEVAIPPGSLAPESAGEAEALSSDQIQALAQAGKVSILEGMATVADASQEALVSELNEFYKYWPRQVLCHAMLVGVSWSGHEGAVGGIDARPKSVGLAIGNTAIEALSALAADKSAKPDLEKVLSAFHYGMLPEIEREDGLAALESLLHSEDFLSRPGGYVVDLIEEGDLFPRDAISEVPANMLVTEGQLIKDAALKATQKRALSQSQRFFVQEEKASPVRYQGVGHSGVNMAFQKEKFSVQAKGFNDLLYEYKPEVIGGVRDTFTKKPRRKVPTRRAMPRYFEPREPVVLLSGAGRAYKHGEDGCFSEDGKLVCRLTGDTIQEVAIVIGNVLGQDIKVRLPIRAVLAGMQTLDSGQIPPESSALYDETLLMDHTNAPIIASEIAADMEYVNRIAPANAVARYDLSEATLAQRVAMEQSMPWFPAISQDADAQSVLALSGMVGKIPSPLGFHIWRQPWTPLHLAWEVEWHPSPDGVRSWQLDEHDYVPIEGEEAPPLTVEAAEIYSGRTLLTPAIAQVVADRIVKFLDEERKRATDQATESQETLLDAALDELTRTDMLACSLGELNETLLGLVEAYHFTPEGEADVPTLDETSLEVEGAPRYPVRAGHLRLRRLRVLDAFGRIFEVPTSVLDAPVRAADVTSAQAELIAMPPRIVQPSRLMFRWLFAEDDAQEATKEKAPICGWVMPDHLDESLEVFDSLGINQGQVQVRPNERGLEWQGVPGNPGPLGGPPQLLNPHLQSFVQGMLAWGVQESTAEPGAFKESALSAFLRMTDATLWTVDPLGREGGEHLSVLVGRPMALVRAQLRLELEGDPASEELTRTPFEIRLGELTRLQDGLIGYFVNDDYSQFYPIHETIADQTRTTRPRSGFLGAIQTVNDFYQNFGSTSSADPVTHPYINRQPTLKIRPDQTIALTLVVDPRGGVHVTSGILPRKRIDLMREHVAQALDNISVTFRIGPILTDPQTIRMPLPTEIKGGWSWVRRTGATVWQEDAVLNESEEARLTPTPAQMEEGWLKLSGALKPKQEE